MRGFRIRNRPKIAASDDQRLLGFRMPQIGHSLVCWSCAPFGAGFPHTIRRLTQRLLRNYACAAAHFLIRKQPLKGLDRHQDFWVAAFHMRLHAQFAVQMAFCRILPFWPYPKRLSSAITVGIGHKIGINSQFLKHSVFNRIVTNHPRIADQSGFLRNPSICV